MNHASSNPQKLNKSVTSDYILRFGPVSNKGFVQFIDCSQGKELTVGINVDDEEFKYRVQEEFPAIVADIIDLAVAIHASDRLAPQDFSRKQRHLHVVLPVRNPELLNAKPFQTKLENLLEWATGSKWVFNFQKRIAPGRSVEHPLLFPLARRGCEVALWSGGLDALAGLYTRLQIYPEKPFVLFGISTNDRVYALQKQVAKKVESIFPSRCRLLRIPIRFHNSDMQPKNKMSRARGIVFTLFGAACAYLMERRVLSVYENGIGAINLPYRASAVGLDHSRSVHPLTLLMVSDLVSELLGEKFRVHNPFLFWTKAEMCKALAEDGRTDLPTLTKSCDSPHRKRNQPMQCGYCSSCILRKQSLAASVIQDKTCYVVPHGNRPAKDPSLHLRNMLAQVSTFRPLLSTSNEIDQQWEALTRNFPILDDIIDYTAETEGLSPAEMQSHLIKLYRTYIAEWDSVASQISADFLEKDNEQQTSDRKSLHTVEGQWHD